ncbi:MAG: MBL fold metallo-hydrolase [Deltaproteobacteria bacterium]|nr:MBL fold metallo-hydrolase [Deltaproteobacteria bacterium]
MADTWVKQFALGPMDNFGYLVGDAQAKTLAVIDPSFDARPLEDEAKRLGAAIELVLLTHGHPDHVRDAERLAHATGAKIAAHRAGSVRKDLELDDGSIVRLGAVEVRVLHTPGHTPDSCCFLAGNALFTGDTLFVGECGRVDLPGSSVDAMHHSLLHVLRGLPDDLIVYPGHHYGPTPTSTLGHEKERNYTLQPRSLAEFRRFMREP